MTDGTNTSSPLNELDAATLDALVQAEFDPTRVPAALRDRAVRLAAILGPITRRTTEGPRWLT